MSVARGIEGRPRACAMACAFVATAASWSAIEAEQGHSEGGRARSSGVVMALGGRQQRSERERAHSSALHARRQRREEAGERERVLWSTILTRFKIKIFN